MNDQKTSGKELIKFDLEIELWGKWLYHSFLLYLYYSLDT
jgi:hypothetical protein